MNGGLAMVTGEGEAAMVTGEAAMVTGEGEAAMVIMLPSPVAESA